MEFPYEGQMHRHSFFRAANRINKSWQPRRKVGEFGDYQGSRLLRSALSADLPSGTITLELKATGQGTIVLRTNLLQEVRRYVRYLSSLDTRPVDQLHSP